MAAWRFLTTSTLCAAKAACSPPAWTGSWTEPPVQRRNQGGVTHRPLRGPAQATVPLVVAYQKGSVSPLVRGYLETTRGVVRSQKRPSPGLSFRPEEPFLPDSI
jgi:hypothetical protein